MRLFLQIAIIVFLSISARAKINYYDDVEIFVKNWFAMMDRNAGTSELLPHISENILMSYPEHLINSHNDFKVWHGKTLSTYTSISHDIRKLEIRVVNSEKCTVHLIVLSKSKTASGETVEFLAEQDWVLEQVEDELKIQSYLVREHIDDKEKP